jgi:hypothetical protein
LRSKEIIAIEKLRILRQDFECSSHFKSLDKPKDKVAKEILTPLSTQLDEEFNGTNLFSNQCSRVLSYVNGTFRQDYSDIIDSRLIKQPIYKAVVFIISYDPNKRNQYTELYMEPLILTEMDYHPIAYKFRSTPNQLKMVKRYNMIFLN